MKPEPLAVLQKLEAGKLNEEREKQSGLEGKNK